MTTTGRVFTFSGTLQSNKKILEAMIHTYTLWIVRLQLHQLDVVPETLESLYIDATGVGNPDTE